MKITGAQALIKTLESEGVEVVFGYPGAANAKVYDELSHSKIKHILPRSEQAAAHEASGYALTSGKVGVCLSTSGPGATNLVTGIATAYMDSVPIIAITGQVSTSLIGKDGFQEVDITGATEPFTKHNYLVKNVKDLPQIVKDAFYIASTGRKGPVLIDIPMDIAAKEFEYEAPKSVDIRGYKPTLKGNDLQVKRVCDAIAKAEHPIIVAGGGVSGSGAEAMLAEFANKYSIPVVTTLMGVTHTAHCGDALMGMLGTHGVQAANYAIRNSDLPIVIGARLSDRAYNTFNATYSGATVVHIDVDPAEIGKNLSTHLPVVGDAKIVMEQIMDKISQRDINPFTEWFESVKELRDKPRPYKKHEDFVNPKYAINLLSQIAPKDAVIATEVGQHQIWTSNNYKLTKENIFLTSGGLGTMGYGLPAAIGAKAAAPERTVISIEGDGSFQMSLTEMATINQWNLPVKIIVFNNSRLGMVRELQKNNHKSNYFSVALDGSPDFVKLAQAYNIKANRISRDDEVEGAFREMLKDDEAYLLEIAVRSEESTL